MRAMLISKGMYPGRIVAWLLPVISFWLVLAFEIPDTFTRYFHRYAPFVFFIVLLLYYVSFQLKGSVSVLAVFGLTMILCALTLSYLWTSGFSDNFVISGLLPYKDAKNYYLGATLLLNGHPIRIAGQALGRPLFPGFLSSMLLVTGQNLKITLAVLAQLAGIGMYLSARQVRSYIGALAGALFITFMYFYYQIIAGYTMSESLGFIGGCFGFVLTWQAARHRNWFDFFLGSGLLLLAVSARAGAFFIFPMLALWAGWAFRGLKRYSILMLVLVLVILAAGYFVANTIYPQLLGVPDGSTFGNFAYTMYGQVRGGLGWHSAIDELGTRNPTRVYQAAWEVFLATPSDFLKGVGKAYADFILPGDSGILAFGAREQHYILDVTLWGLTIVLLLRGVYLMVFRNRSLISTLLLAGFIGIVLSIPFLPPVDGGRRFYASTMPFFFVVLSVGAGQFPGRDEQQSPSKIGLTFLRFAAITLTALTVLLPPVTLRASSKPGLGPPRCSSDQRAFSIMVNTGSYVDLVQNENASCGLAPDICYEEFLKHNTEMHIDDFYQQLDVLAVTSPSPLRIIPTINLLDGHFQYFVIPGDHAQSGSSTGILSGCAVRIQTENQRIFLVESISASGE